MKKVALSISLLHTSGRDVLSGIFHHIESSADWNLAIWQTEENPPTPQKLAKSLDNGLDGIIITERIPDDFIRMLSMSDIPLVGIGIHDVDLERRTAPTAFIRNDNAGIGQHGAQYLAGLGQFQTFAFIPAGTADWSDSREVAFHKELEKQAKSVVSFRSKNLPGSEEDIAELAAWLTSLKKPAAVMAACDWRAIHVLSACETAKLKVPRQIALLGVDNDELTCLHATPPLSSILPGHVEMGRLAAQALNQMMRHHGRRKPTPPKIILSHARQLVIERSSSRILPPATLLVERAKRFIRENAHTGIRVNDVVAHAHVSRRLLELRLRETDGETIQGLIEKARLGLLRRLLSSSSRPIATLARESGFPDANALAHLFKKRYGMSMRQFRANAFAARTTPKKPPK